jgi:hypothetical protein
MIIRETPQAIAAVPPQVSFPVEFCEYAGRCVWNLHVIHIGEPQ